MLRRTKDFCSNAAAPHALYHPAVRHSMEPANRLLHDIAPAGCMQMQTVDYRLRENGSISTTRHYLQETNSGVSVTALPSRWSTSLIGLEKISHSVFLLLGELLPSVDPSTLGLNASLLGKADLPLSLDRPLPSSLQNVSHSTICQRLGHSAILSGDGSKIIVVGGVVADSKPADPQIAELHLGQCCDQDNWRWVVPSNSSSLPLNASAIYGHTATLLPDEIMMVAGGYVTSAPKSITGSKEVKNDHILFYNITSHTWLSVHDISIRLDLESVPNSTTHGNSSAGLGYYLGIASSCLLGISLLCLLWTRLHRSRKAGHESKVQPCTSHPEINGYTHRPSSMFSWHDNAAVDAVELGGRPARDVLSPVHFTVPKRQLVVSNPDPEPLYGTSKIR